MNRSNKDRKGYGQVSVKLNMVAWCVVSAWLYPVTLCVGKVAYSCTVYRFGMVKSSPVMVKTDIIESPFRALYYIFFIESIFYFFQSLYLYY